ncbi:MAG TPA: polyphosphate kinase 2 family protein [Micromonosporaceae bacterium]|nr:polyphosphate kinase 2 family protein [Micromonosporaceae bacterium]
MMRSRLRLGIMTGMAQLRELLQIRPGSTADLTAIDPRSTPGLPETKEVRADRKGWARARTTEVGAALSNWQERLYAQAKVTGDPRRLLLVLQAMDCGGKDGTVRHVVGMLNPLGVRITSFGVPTEEERSHDFLWRIRRALPPAGYIGVFNRSHYEDVLVVRVHKLVEPDEWERRYDAINAFEQEITNDGITVLKVMLHISADEQRARLLDRLNDPEKYWKYNPGDIDERARWDDYQQAFTDALTRCSTGIAPWFVVPADRKWYRDWAVAHLIGETLAGMDPQYPPADFDVAAERARLSA